MTVSLKSNFLSNARGFIFLDGGGITWTFNSNTNQLTATAAGGAGIGTVTSVGLTSTGGDIAVTGTSPVTTAGTFDVELKTQTGVTAASYTYASITVNSKGVITAVSNGTQPVTSIGSTTLTVGGTTAAPTVNLSTTQVNNIALGGSALQSASVVDSITGAGTSASPLQLSGDAASPGNNYYYGTNASGTKGWYSSEAGANPTATIGMTANNGTATTWMRSDASPAINPAIAPVWTGLHTFDVAPYLPAGAKVANAVTLTWTDSGGTVRNVLQLYSDNSVYLDGYVGVNIRTNNTAEVFAFSSTGTLKIPGALGVNGVTPPAQTTGWGTPVGNAVVANYNITDAGGANSNTNKAVAEIIAVLKAAGLIGA